MGTYLENINNDFFSINLIYEKAIEYYERIFWSGNSREVEKFIEDNGISDAIISSFKLGYANQTRDSFYKFMKSKGFDDNCLAKSGLIKKSDNGDFVDQFHDRIIIPIINDKNVILGIGSISCGLQECKYLNVFNKVIPEEERSMIFGLNISVDTKQNNFIICEGYKDVIALHGVGLTQTISILGGNITKRQAAILSEYTRNVFLAFDTDDYGKSFSEKARETLEEYGINVWEMDLKSFKDPFEYIQKTKKRSLLK